MIAAAVPSENIMNAMGPGKGQAGAAGTDGFNALLAMLMSVQAAPAQVAEGSDAEVVELVSNEMGDAQIEADSMPVQDLIQELAEWMQPQSKADGETAAPVIELTPQVAYEQPVANGTAVKAQTKQNVMPLPTAIIVALMTAMHTQKALTETQKTKNTNPELALIQNAANPAEVAKATESEKPAETTEPSNQGAAMNMAAGALIAQPVIVAKTTPAEPETVAVKSSTTTVSQSAEASTKQAISAAGATQPEAATGEPIKWNLSELIHRFDETLTKVMGEQPAATAVTAQTTTEQPAVVATANKTKTAVKSDETTAAVTAQPQTHTWQAEPVSDKSNTTRMPHMIEQVRQASEWLAEKAEGVIRVGDHGVEANMKLYPPDMGGVRVSLNVGNDLNVQAQFIAESPETAQVLRQNMSQLQEAFVRQGLTLNKVQVVVAPAASTNTGSAGQQNFESARREPQTMSQQNRQFENRNSQERRQRQQA